MYINLNAKAPLAHQANRKTTLSPTFSTSNFLCNSLDNEEDVEFVDEDEDILTIVSDA